MSFANPTGDSAGSFTRHVKLDKPDNEPQMTPRNICPQVEAALKKAESSVTPTVLLLSPAIPGLGGLASGLPFVPRRTQVSLNTTTA